MSTQIFQLVNKHHLHENISVTSFYGGIEKGKMLQINVDDRYIQLTKDQVIELKDVLIDWILDI